MASRKTALMQYDPHRVLSRVCLLCDFNITQSQNGQEYRRAENLNRKDDGYHERRSYLAKIANFAGF
jgi:hypothetical protein